MLEKTLKLSKLLDLYGGMLTDKQREAMDMYYNCDMSLAEVGEELSVSRQGVRDLIKKAEEELRFYEDKLGLAVRFRNTQASAERLLALLESTEASGEVRRAAQDLAEVVRS